MSVISKIREHKIVVILRGVQPADVMKIADALYEGGIRLLEITLNSPDALSSIRELTNRMGDRLWIGAGTVLDAVTANAAIDAGAKFIISPSLDIETIKTTKQRNIISIPGAFTPTEIVTAYKNGADIVKIFPASVGVNYIKDLRGPLPHIPLMPTGGVNLQNIRAFFDAGAVATGIGSALVDSRQTINDHYLEQLTATAAEFVKAASNNN